MWLKRWFSALWLRLSLLPRPAPQLTHTPDRVKVLRLLSKLEPERYSVYTSATGQGQILEVPYAHIDLYSAALAEAYELVCTDRPVPPEWCKPVLTRVSLDRFLTSSDGYYLDPRQAVRRFKEKATHLCEALEASDDAAYGLPEHNLRMLTRLLINLQHLTSELLKIGPEAP